MNKDLEKPIHVIVSPKGFGKAYYEFKKITKENERLNKDTSQYYYNHIMKWHNKCIELEERIKEYQESYRKEIDYWRIQFSNKEDRINKAIEYIEEWQKFPHTNGSTHEELRNLKQILKGEE